MDDDEARVALTEPFAHLDPNECWEWPGKRTADGYGIMTYTKGRGWHAHRVACHLFVTPLRRGLLACHTCDNPPCVNWRHLYAGTFAENMRDAVERLGTNRGPNNSQTKLTEWDVRDIREMYANGCCTMKQIGEAYGVDKVTIRHALNGTTWDWVDPDRPRFVSRGRGAPSPNRQRDPLTGRYLSKR